FILVIRPSPTSTLLPYTTLFDLERRGTNTGARLSRIALLSRGLGDRRLRLLVLVYFLFMLGFTMMEATLTLFIERRIGARDHARSEEHTSELQSRRDLVCRLLLE